MAKKENGAKAEIILSEKDKLEILRSIIIEDILRMKLVMNHLFLEALRKKTEELADIYNVSREALFVLYKEVLLEKMKKFLS